MTTQSEQSAVFSNSERIKTEIQCARARGAGAGLESMAAAFAAAGFPDTVQPMRSRALGNVEAMPINTACGTIERPAGELLQSVQAQLDLQLCKSCARKLKGRMAADGHDITQEMLADGIQAGALALAQWRAGAGDATEIMAARVAWRAIVHELSQDRFGDSVQIESVSDDWLWHNAQTKQESRQERAARLFVERAAFQRQSRLQARLASLPGGRGKRQAVIDKVGNAAAMLLQGERLDTAAAMAGFKGHGRTKAADRLIQAVKRIGLLSKTGTGGQQFTARMSTREDGERRGEFIAIEPQRAALVLGSQFVSSWDTGLIAVSDIDGCIEWQAVN